MAIGPLAGALGPLGRSRASASRLWVPEDIGSDLRYYLNADDLPGANGDFVSSWTDRAGGITHLAAGSNRPTLATNAYNGKNAARFDGVDDYLAGASTIASLQNTAAYCFAVVKKTAGSGRLHFLGQGTGTDTGCYMFGSQFTGNPFEQMECIIPGIFLTTRLFTPITGTNGVVSYSICVDYNGGTAANDVRYCGETAFASGSDIANASQGSAVALPQVGRRGSVSGSYFSGDIMALLTIYPKPSLATIQKLEGWYAWTYGNVAALPSGHPYKSAAPTI